nr:hypothetical protein [Klebsiella variicola]
MTDLLRTWYFGTTGSGKTETFYGFIVNFLLWCRGYCLSDGKADNKLAFATGRWRAVSAVRMIITFSTC